MESISQQKIYCADDVESRILCDVCDKQMYT